MKKNVFYLMLVLLTLFTVVSVMEMNAQVTIGENTAPHPGAVLELRGDKGLLLPRVSLADANVFQLATEKKDEAVGMLVYNLNARKENGLKGEGVYVWNSQSWTLVAKSERNILVSVVKISPEKNVTTVAPGGTLKIEAVIEPANATNKGLNWSASAGSIDAIGMFTAGSTAGDVTISAQTVDGSNITSNPVTIRVGSSNTVTGQNGVYEVHTFGSLGTWMVNGSKEGSPSNSEQVQGGGAYYSYTAAQSACPNGYAVPTETQLKNLLTYLKDTATADEKTAWNASTGVGFYNNGSHVANALCYLWTNKTNYYYYYTPSFEYMNTENNSITVPVRCIKQ